MVARHFKVVARWLLPLLCVTKWLLGVSKLLLWVYKWLLGI